MIELWLTTPKTDENRHLHYVERPDGRPPVLIRSPGRMGGGISMEEMGQILTTLVQVQAIGVTVQMILKQ